MLYIIAIALKITFVKVESWLLTAAEVVMIADRSLRAVS
jgi:hypothetical protein